MCQGSVFDKAALRGFFLEPSGPLNLAVFRLTVFLVVVRVLTHIDFQRLVEIPARLRVPPWGYASFFHLIPINSGLVAVLQWLGVGAAFLALIGFHTRVAAIVCLLCSTYLLGLPLFFGRIHHVDHHLIWFMALLAASPCADVLSVDALRAALRREGDFEPPASAAYTLPIRFAWLLFGIIYFFPGVAKAMAGPQWFLGDHLTNLLHHQWTLKGFEPAFRIDHYPQLLHVAGLAVVIFQVSFLFLVLFRRTRALAVIGGLAFHVLNEIFLGIAFRALVFCYTVFVDWESLAARIGERAFGTTLLLHYNAQRASQRRIVAALQSANLFGRIAYRATTDPFLRGTVDSAELTGAHLALALLRRSPFLPVFLPFARLVPLRSQPPARQVHLRTTVVIGASLIFANLYCGAARIDSWPFSIYPRFSNIRTGKSANVFQIVVRHAGGAQTVVPSKLHAETIAHIVALPAGPERLARFHALRELLINDGLRLQPGDKLQIYAAPANSNPPSPTAPRLLLE